MLLFVVVISCLFYSPSFGQMSMNTSYPRIGPIYAVRNNNSVLNFTFVYPTKYQFDKLFVRFTMYDFLQNDTTNPRPYPFGYVNFTDSNFSLPWVVPPLILTSNNYVITCFEWYQADTRDEIVSDTNECVLSRIPLNSKILLTDYHNITTVVVTDNTAMITTHFPRILPYNQVNVTAMLNGTMSPSMMKRTSNTTYSAINTFTFMKLTPGTYYNACIQYSYTNEKINGSQKMDDQCQLFMTQTKGSITIIPTPSMNITSTSLMNILSSPSMNTASTSSMNIVSSPSMNTASTSSINIAATSSMNIISTSSMNIVPIPSMNITSTSPMNIASTPPTNSSTKFLPNMIVLILLIMIAFI